MPNTDGLVVGWLGCVIGVQESGQDCGVGPERTPAQPESWSPASLISRELQRREGRAWISWAQPRAHEITRPAPFLKSPWGHASHLGTECALFQ